MTAMPSDAAQAEDYPQGTRLAYLDRSPNGPDKVMVRIGIVAGERTYNPENDSAAIPVAALDEPNARTAKPVRLADIIGDLGEPEGSNRHVADRTPPLVLRGLSHAGRHRRRAGDPAWRVDHTS